MQVHEQDCHAANDPALASTATAKAARFGNHEVNTANPEQGHLVETPPSQIDPAATARYARMRTTIKGNAREANAALGFGGVGVVITGLLIAGTVVTHGALPVVIGVVMAAISLASLLGGWLARSDADSALASVNRREAWDHQQLKSQAAPKTPANSEPPQRKFTITDCDSDRGTPEPPAPAAKQADPVSQPDVQPESEPPTNNKSRESRADITNQVAAEEQEQRDDPPAEVEPKVLRIKIENIDEQPNVETTAKLVNDKPVHNDPAVDLEQGVEANDGVAQPAQNGPKLYGVKGQVNKLIEKGDRQQPAAIRFVKQVYSPNPKFENVLHSMKSYLEQYYVFREFGDANDKYAPSSKECTRSATPNKTQVVINSALQQKRKESIDNASKSLDGANDLAALYCIARRRSNRALGDIAMNKVDADMFKLLDWSILSTVDQNGGYDANVHSIKAMDLNDAADEAISGWGKLPQLLGKTVEQLNQLEAHVNDAVKELHSERMALEEVHQKRAEFGLQN